MDELERVQAVYDRSTQKYVEAIGTELSSEFETAHDQAHLVSFAQRLAENSGPVLDVGCGPGRIASFLAARGLDVAGVDLSPEMVAAARVAHPSLRFDVAPLTNLPVGDRSQRGLAYWYSIIATEPEQLAFVWAELERVLSDDGLALIAFQAGSGEADRREDAFGSGVDFTLYRHDPDVVAAGLTNAGFQVETHSVRPADRDHERGPQAVIVVSRSVSCSVSCSVSA